MLSYEDIFLRHHNTRPVSYLDSHLDSPVTRIPTPVVLRSPALYKERRRPTSIACLDGVSKKINDLYRLPSKDSTPRIFDNSPKLYLKEFAPKPHTESHRHPLRDITPRIHTESHRLPSRDITPRIHTESHRLPLRDITPRIHTESHRLPLREAGILDGSHKFPEKDVTRKVLRENRRFPLKDDKLESFVDNYRHAVTFPDRHLSRREIPLCTPDDLLDIIREPTGYYALPTDPWNEVYPDIYLSDAPTALCTTVLKRIGITHVLNAAQGREKGCGQVNTTSGFYSQSGIQFLGVPAFDNIVFRLYPYFEQAAQFIEDGLKSKGKVLVHCRAGISRSATLVCAFLMLKRGLSAQEAVKTVRKNRAIIPNDGFLQQLCDLNDKLKQKNRY